MIIWNIYDFITNDQLQNLRDGEYKGAVNQGLDRANVLVTIMKGKIVDVEIIDIVAIGWRQDAVLENFPDQVIALSKV